MPTYYELRVVVYDEHGDETTVAVSNPETLTGLSTWAHYLTAVPGEGGQIVIAPCAPEKDPDMEVKEAVYVVMSGEDHQGGSLNGVYKDLHQASLCAKKQMDAMDPDGPWEATNPLERTNRVWIVWRSGGDWVRITSEDIR